MKTVPYNGPKATTIPSFARTIEFKCAVTIEVPVTLDCRRERVSQEDADDALMEMIERMIEDIPGVIAAVVASPDDEE